MPVLDDQWVANLVAGTGKAGPRPGLDARVAVTVGADERVVLDIKDGQVVGAVDGDGEVGVEVPLTPEQADAIATGELSLAVAYMKGDVKPVGSTGALAVFIEVAEDPVTWSAWRS